MTRLKEGGLELFSKVEAATSFEKLGFQTAKQAGEMWEKVARHRPKESHRPHLRHIWFYRWF